MAQAAHLDRFDSEAKERKKRITAFLLTTAIYIGLFLLILFLAIYPPNPPEPEAEGMEIVFGTDATGMNNTFEPVGAENPQPKTQPEIQPQSSPPTPPVEDNMETSNEADAPTVKPQEKVKPQPKTPPTPEPVKEPTPPQPKSNPAFEFKGTNKTKGNDQTEGDKGDKDGDKNSKSWEDRGVGNSSTGVGYTYGKGRSLAKPTSLQADQQVEGSITIEIEVNQDGKVVGTRVLTKGTTITNTDLQEEARRAAMKVEWNAKEDAPERDFGTVVFTFRLR